MSQSTQDAVLVFITPLALIDQYGAEIDVTEQVYLSSISEIREFIDSEDFDFGLFAYGNINITFDNSHGKFNDHEDSRSIFPIQRDYGKVRIVYRQTTITRETNGTIINSSDVDTILYNGIINDAGTIVDVNLDKIQLEVLSLDSIITTVSLASGQLVNGNLLSLAIATILDQAKIETVLVINPLNINLDQDSAIDDVTIFDGLNGRDFFKQVLPACNSILLIDNTFNLIIKSRIEDLVAPVLDLYGPFDLQGRENIKDLFDYNSGVQRTFNSVIVNDIEVGDLGHITEFGLKQKQFTFSFLTNQVTAQTIAQRMVDEFKVQKIELSVSIPLALGKDTKLLQTVRITNPLKIVPQVGTFLPVVGDSVYSDISTPYPQELGSIEIDDNVKFKIIERSHDVTNYVTKLKLRQTGKAYGEGYF